MTQNLPLIILYVQIILFQPLIIFAQNSDHKVSLGTGYVFRLVNPEAQFSSFPAVSLHASYYLNPTFDLNLALGITPSGFENNPRRTDLTDVDILLRLKLYKPLQSSSNTHLGPYFISGLNFFQFQWDGSAPDVALPLGAGLRLFPHSRATLDFQSVYKQSLTNNIDYWVFSAGINLAIGKTSMDSDRDGIPDVKDQCPLVAGLSAFHGCPDSDSDGIPDPEDSCPDVAGSIRLMGCPEIRVDTDMDGVPDLQDSCLQIPGSPELNGCPDTDKDGIVDSEDLCPETSGSIKGCPDTDGDGTPNPEDECPDEPGSAMYNGCPDLDGDGVIDKKDKCPETVGKIALDGCPEVDLVSIQTLSNAEGSIHFRTGSAILLPESLTILDKIADILITYEDYKLRIAGHTDSMGGTRLNQLLSEKRARACADYLILRGIEAERLTYLGNGENNPIADNITKEGRKKNRRVEFDLHL